MSENFPEQDFDQDVDQEAPQPPENDGIDDLIAEVAKEMAYGEESPESTAPAQAPSEEPAAEEPQATPGGWELADVAQQIGVEDERSAANQYVAAVVTLRNDPVKGFNALMDHYVQSPQEAQQVMAHLAAKHNLDPLDVDVDDYRQKEPERQAQSELQQLRSQVAQLQAESQVQRLTATGQYPLLNDPTVAQAMSQYAVQNRLSLEDAYTLAVHKSPDLSAKHSQAVAGGGKARNEAQAEKARQTRFRRARAADLPRGTAGARYAPPSGDSIDDLIKEVAAEIGYSGS